MILPLPIDSMIRPAGQSVIARAQGRMARTHRQPITANPYLPDTESHHDWRTGWMDRDRIEEPMPAEDAA